MIGCGTEFWREMSVIPVDKWGYALRIMFEGNVMYGEQLRHICAQACISIRRKEQVDVVPFQMSGNTVLKPPIPKEWMPCRREWHSCLDAIVRNEGRVEGPVKEKEPFVFGHQSNESTADFLSVDSQPLKLALEQKSSIDGYPHVSKVLKLDSQIS